MRCTGGALDIAVVGAGTAGSAAAIFLARAGHQVTLFEAVERPGPVGAGIMIQPTGMSVLARLGLLEPVLARGAIVDRLRCVTRSGRRVIDLAYADLRHDAFGLGLHRGVLFHILFDAVESEAGITLECGTAIDRVERLADWRRALGTRAGGTVGPYDLVVVADGARSVLRDDTGLVRRAREYAWGALWFIGLDPAGTFDGELFQVVDGTRHMFGLLPSGLGPDGEVRRVSLFWSIRADRLEAWRRAGLGPWKQLLAAMDPRAAPLLDQISSVGEVLFARYWDVVLSPWHTDRVVHLGDAAHAMSPQLGQGANIALIDAMVLADCLAGPGEIRDALAAYSRQRRLHLGYYQWATRFLTPFFQSDAAPLGWLRDTFMGLACKFPLLRSKMIRTMCGVERGFLRSRALPLPSLPSLLEPPPPG
jgi:2-polyprenyl-6-methoxyphenol hydroxylase-like FAD-dependent oxidoreductase